MRSSAFPSIPANNMSVDVLSSKISSISKKAHLKALCQLPPNKLQGEGEKWGDFTAALKELVLDLQLLSYELG